MKRLRFGLLVGFALGYWFGTKAGRERHRQLEALLQRARESEAVAVAAERARVLVETGMDKGRELVEQVRSDDDEPSGADAVLFSDEVAEPSVDEPAVDTAVGPNGSVNPGLPHPEIT